MVWIVGPELSGDKRNIRERIGTRRCVNSKAGRCGLCMGCGRKRPSDCKLWRDTVREIAVLSLLTHKCGK